VAVALVVSVFSTITELASTLVLYPPGWRTMAVYVAYYMEEGLFSKAVGMAFLMLLIVEASVLAAGSLLKANPVERQVFLSPFSMLTIDIPKKGRRTRESMKVFAQIIRGKVSRRKASLRFSSRRRRAAAGSDRESLAAMELKLLGMQINPHFFFNTLNTIVHLIETDKDAAIATVGKLSSLFRYSLDASEARSISLAKELEYLRTYLEIEKLRFGDNLSFSLDVPREVMDCQIHPFLIQPIVENAVRHGKDGEGKAYVTLSIRQERPGVLSVIITDYGTANFDPDLLERASGTGIRNVRRRLDNLYGGDLEFSKNLPHGLAVAMRIFTHEGEA
jgi:sensor histidine kinase YesM